MNQIPVVLSGWSGVGTSVISMLLALVLNRNYIYFGQLFREIGESLGYANEGISRVEIDEILEKHIGILVDKYIDYVLLNEKGFVLESDIAAFRLKKRSGFVSLFLYASDEVRLSRVVEDNRGDKAMEVLKLRDKSLQKLYQDLWGVDVFNLEEINNSYWFSVDSSNLSIENTLREVLIKIKKNIQLADDLIIEQRISENCDLYKSDGKTGLKKKLVNLNLLVPSKELAKNMCLIMPDEINRLPAQIKDYFSVL